jgi:hypothetical protein
MRIQKLEDEQRIQMQTGQLAVISDDLPGPDNLRISGSTLLILTIVFQSSVPIVIPLIRENSGLIEWATLRSCLQKCINSAFSKINVVVKIAALNLDEIY